MSEATEPQPHSTEENKEDVVPATFKEAFFASPGPRTWKEAAGVAGKGFCMGTADIIPGVSGGTIAFITGIYQNLLDAIASFDGECIGHLLRGRGKQALATAHVRFLLPLLFGIGLAIISTAKLMHYLIHEHPVPTWSLFFGLIAASILVVSKEVSDWMRGTPALILGAILAWCIVGLIPVDTTEAYWFLFLCGMIAICAMILPGISGSFLLLILGKYIFVTGAVKDPLASGNLMILLVFGCGCVVGILGFSRVLGYCLRHFHNITMCLLIGFMVGAMRKIWPWKNVVQSVKVNGKERVLQTSNYLPDTLDAQVAWAIGLAVVGFAAVLLLERVSQKSSSSASTPQPAAEL